MEGKEKWRYEKKRDGKGRNSGGVMSYDLI